MCAKSTTFLCFSEHCLIISFQNLESYHGNSLPAFSFEKDPFSPQRNHLQVAIQLPLLCPGSVFTHYLLSDLGQEPCQWPVKWNSIQRGWFRLGHILLSSWPPRQAPPPPALARGGLNPGGWGTARFPSFQKHLEAFLTPSWLLKDQDSVWQFPTPPPPWNGVSLFIGLPKAKEHPQAPAI